MSNKTSDKNVANVEELIQEYKTYNDLDGIQDLSIYVNALEHILAEREQKDKQIKELEEENYMQRKQLNDAFERGFIHKDKVKEALEDIEDYLDRLNGPDEDMNYIRKIKKELLERKK